MKKSVVFYHANCADGFVASFIAWLKFYINNTVESVEFISIQYGADFNYDVIGKTVYILDFSFPPHLTEYIMQKANEVIWLDHHITSIDAWNSHDKNTSLDRHTIVLDVNKSGAMLAHDYFFPEKEVPRFVKFVDDRDRWVFQYPESKAFNAGLSLLKPWTHEGFYDEIYKRIGTDRVIEKGALLLDFIQSQVKDAVRSSVQKILLTPDGERVLVTVVNSPTNISEVGTAIYERDPYMVALMWFYSHKEDMVICSLRGSKNKDVSTIAKKFGGGGHKSAAGFKMKIEEFFKIFRKSNT